MSLLSGGRKNDLPTMSWESVLDPGRTSARPASDAPQATAGSDAFPPGSIKLEIPSLDLGAVEPRVSDADLDVPARPILAPAPLGLPTNDPEAVVEAVSFTIPDIKEATPVAPLSAAEQRDLELSNSGPVATAAGPAAATIEASAPIASPPPAIAPPPPAPPIAGVVAPPAPPQAVVPAPAPDAASPVIPAPVVPLTLYHPPVAPHAPAPHPHGPAQAHHHRKRRASARRLGSLVLTLAILSGLVAAAVVFGRPYLFPDDWDPATKPFAVAVEEAFGGEFVEPVTVTADPPQVYAVRRTEQLVGDWQSQLPAWRALGLANGDVDQTAVDGLLAGWSPAIYSVADGQVYHDATLTGADLDAWLTLALAQAAIDQDVNWSTEQSTRTLDGAALVAADVWQRSVEVQQATEFDLPIGQPDVTRLAYLPPVLGYQVVAPAMFAEVLPPADDPTSVAGADQPVDRLASAAPEPSLPAAEPALADGDVLVAGPAAKDRSFWYLVFAAYVDAPQADAASRAIAEASLTLVDRAGTTCAVASFTGGDAGGTATLALAIDAWVLAAPAAMTATAGPAGGPLQLTSCDPGPGFVNGARFGTARELIGFRLGTLALTNELAGATEAVAQDALARYEQSGIGASLAALPLDTSPADAAATARNAVRDLLGTPPAGPVAGS